MSQRAAPHDKPKVTWQKLAAMFDLIGFVFGWRADWTTISQYATSSTKAQRNFNGDTEVSAT
jgi:hypothetical protein